MHKFTHCQVAVLDWMNGGLVHARRGQRTDYQPLCDAFPRFVGKPPLKLVHELRQRMGVTRFYLADLDALQGRGETGASELALTILNEGLTLWWDRGFEDAPLPATRRAALFDRCGPRFHPVLGTESCRSPRELFARLASREPHPWTLSLDLMSRDADWHWFGQAVMEKPELGLEVDRTDRSETRVGPGKDSFVGPKVCDSWAAMPMSEVALRSVQLGVRELIVLNLADVGTSHCTTGPLLHELRQKLPTTVLVAGGGVRDVNGFQRLLDHGADHVLVGTWLWARLSQALP
ncbi:MAG: HisA/HisF-related TIM barrel protein [Pirellulaceae bacterium]|nr:HisA/HisF-related TIM barrel protein [Pirellulaceae bacterium]